MARRDSSDVKSSPQPIRRSTDTTPSGSLLGHFTSLASSFQRRLSGGLSSSPTSSKEDTSAFSRGPYYETDPPLPPISFQGFLQSTHERVMSEKLAEEIRLMMPGRLQLQDHWDLVYSLEQHGVSLATLYARCKAFNSPQTGYVVIVRDWKDNVFGAFLTEYPHVHAHYYGTGECFLFKFKQLSDHHLYSAPNSFHAPYPRIPKSPAVPSSSTEASQTSQHSQQSTLRSPLSMDTSHLSILTDDTTRPSSPGPQYQFKGFSYTGLNDYMILCTPQFLSVGGGYL